MPEALSAKIASFAITATARKAFDAILKRRKITGAAAMREALAAWLSANTVVTPPPVTPAPAGVPKAGQTLTIGKGTHVLDGVDVARGQDQLILYTTGAPATGLTTTNQWGVEVSIGNGKVITVNDREKTASATGTQVPAGGYVLSGHNLAAQWLRTNAVVGAAVAASDTPVPVRPPVVIPDPTLDPTPAPSSSGKTQATYYMMWSNSPSIRLKDIPTQINEVRLAFIQNAFLVGWGPFGKDTCIADVKALRARGVKVTASVGGAGGQVNTADRAGFVAVVKAVHAEMPLDGIDWDVESGSFNASDVVAISTQLKKDLGAGFLITLAPNGSNVDNYLSIAVQLQKAGALDTYGQQFYDAPVSKEAAKGRIDQAVAAGIPEAKITVGMMIAADASHWTVDQCVANMKYLQGFYPDLGAYLWEASRPGTADWATRIAALLRAIPA